MDGVTYTLDIPYAWAQGSRFSADPTSFARQLNALQMAKGFVAAEDVLEASAEPSAPLHDDLEWDDDVAAHKYRLNTVQNAIGSLRVMPIDIVHEERMTPIRAAVLYDTVNAADGVEEPREAYPRRYLMEVGIMDQEQHRRKQRTEALSKVEYLAARLRSLPGCELIAADLDEIVQRFSE